MTVKRNNLKTLEKVKYVKENRSYKYASLSSIFNIKDENPCHSKMFLFRLG